MCYCLYIVIINAKYIKQSQFVQGYCKILIKNLMVYNYCKENTNFYWLKYQLLDPAQGNKPFY